MPRLPKGRIRNIKPVNPIKTSGLNVAAEALNQAARIGAHIQNVQDTSNANKEISTFKVQASRKSDELALQYGDDPARYEQEFTNYIEQSKKDLEANTQVSLFNKNQFKQAVDESIVNLEEVNYQNTRKLQFNKVQNDIVTTTDNYNDLSYTYGKDGDREQLENIEKVELDNLLVSSSQVIPADQLKGLKKETVEGIYKNYLTGGIVSRPEETLLALEAGEYDDKLDAITIDKFKEASKKSIQRTNKQREDGEEEIRIIHGNESIIRLNGKIDSMNISRGTTEDLAGTIRNKSLNNIDAIINLNNDIEQSKKVLSNKEYRNYKQKIYTVTNAFKSTSKGKEKFEEASFFDKSPSVGTFVETYINNNMSPYDNFDNSQVYLDTVSEARLQGIDLESREMKDKKQVNLILRDKIATYYDVDPEANDFDTQVRDKLNRKVFDDNTRILEQTSKQIQINADPRGIL